ncbi:unnamed protein product [Amoebophrya sp. A25]|nr:unnamed protein product [Amoebophrya sp. A25]|eukprot:GSA25T00003222001.1
MNKPPPPSLMNIKTMSKNVRRQGPFPLHGGSCEIVLRFYPTGGEEVLLFPDTSCGEILDAQELANFVHPTCAEKMENGNYELLWQNNWPVLGVEKSSICNNNRGSAALDTTSIATASGAVTPTSTSAQSTEARSRNNNYRPALSPLRPFLTNRRVVLHVRSTQRQEDQMRLACASLSRGLASTQHLNDATTELQTRLRVLKQAVEKRKSDLPWRFYITMVAAGVFGTLFMFLFAGVCAATASVDPAAEYQSGDVALDPSEMQAFSDRKVEEFRKVATGAGLLRGALIATEGKLECLSHTIEHDPRDNHNGDQNVLEEQHEKHPGFMSSGTYIAKSLVDAIGSHGGHGAKPETVRVA